MGIGVCYDIYYLKFSNFFKQYKYQFQERFDGRKV